MQAAKETIEDLCKNHWGQLCFLLKTSFSLIETHCMKDGRISHMVVKENLFVGQGQTCEAKTYLHTAFNGRLLLVPCKCIFY